MTETSHFEICKSQMREIQDFLMNSFQIVLLKILKTISYNRYRSVAELAHEFHLMYYLDSVR